jgi:hypothetical protein
MMDPVEITIQGNDGSEAFQAKVADALNVAMDRGRAAETRDRGRREGWLVPSQPYALDMNYGRALNEHMDLIPEGAWGCFLDHDAAWTTRDWYRQILEAIAFRPEAGLFTAVASRIGPRWQRAGERDSHDMTRHRAIGEERARSNRTLLDATDTKGIGGVVMVISKDAWRSVGGFVDGMRCVDHMMHFAQRAAGRSIYVIESLYVYHARLTSGDSRLALASPVAAGCPCRGHEETPTSRIDLP